MPMIATAGAVHLHGVHGRGDMELMLLVAFMLSYAVLDAACRVRAAQGRCRTAWLTGGSLVVGLGIFAFHFVALLSVELPLPITADPMTFGISAVTAVIAAAGALHHVNRGVAGLPPLAISAGLKGFALIATHYTSVAALHVPATIAYRPWTVAASAVIAIGVSGASLALAERLRSEEPGRAAIERVVGALVMAAGLVALHHVSAGSGQFVPDGLWVEHATRGHHLHELAQAWLTPWVVGGGVAAVSAFAAAATLSRRAHWRQQTSPSHDRLTGLGNRELLRKRLAQALDHGAPCAMVTVRIKRFEQIRQRLGRPDAERLLVRVGQRLRSAARPDDLVAFMGAAEFAVLVLDDRPEVVHDVADRIDERLGCPVKLGTLTVLVPTALGTATPVRDDTPGDVVRRAQIASRRTATRPPLSVLEGGATEAPDNVVELRAA